MSWPGCVSVFFFSGFLMFIVFLIIHLLFYLFIIVNLAIYYLMFLLYLRAEKPCMFTVNVKHSHYLLWTFLNPFN